MSRSERRTTRNVPLYNIEVEEYPQPNERKKDHKDTQRTPMAPTKAPMITAPRDIQVPSRENCFAPEAALEAVPEEVDLAVPVALALALVLVALVAVAMEEPEEVVAVAAL